MKLGDVVQLKCGGPKMVVTAYYGQSFAGMEPTVTCMWFSKNDTVETDTFIVRLLEAMAS